jgi:hypothetical protein
MAETVAENIQEAIAGFFKQQKEKVAKLEEQKKQLPKIKPIARVGFEALPESFQESIPGKVLSMALPENILDPLSVAGGGMKSVQSMSNARAKILAAEGSIKAMSVARKKILDIGEKPLERLEATIPTVTKKATEKEEKLLSASEQVSEAFREIKERAGLLWERIKSPITGAEWDPLIRSHVGTLQLAGMKTERFVKALNKKYPNKLRREALTNYINAAGDEGRLLEWSRQAPKGSRAGYKQALNLSEEEKAWAKNIRDYFDEMHEKAVDEGFLDSYVENYLPGLYKRKSKVGQRLLAAANFHSSNAGLLLKNPFFTKEKHFASYFEAEKLGQLEARNKDIGFLITQYQHAFDKAQATRIFMKELMAGVAKDGKPLAAPIGYVHMLEEEAAKKVDPRLLIKPSGVTEETIAASGELYKRGPENAAFRKWRWAGKDTAGADVIMEGELKFHPEIARQINNIFGRSAIRDWEVAGMHPGQALLNLSAGFKGVLLGPSLFHPVQVAEHAIFHGVNPNPLTLAKINPEDPMVHKAVNAGVMLYDYARSDLFKEGSIGGGYLAKIPGAGRYVEKWSDLIFKDYIPRLKMAMFKEAYARNMRRYAGKRTEEQIAMLTADQANAAFGELNYTALGRNKTLQDVLRLTLLAPDFLEARARFAGQAISTAWKGEGMEQLMAAGFRGAGLMFFGCQTLNYTLNGKMYPDKPFSVMINGREFVTRSVPGDIYHLIRDPGSFVNHRLNPTTIRTAITALQHRTSTGKWLSVPDMIVDFFQRQKPIPFQKTADQKLYQSILNSMGVTDIEERSVALKEAMKIRARTPFTHPTREIEEKAKASIGYVKELNKAKTEEEKRAVMDKLMQEIKEKKLNPKDIRKIIKQSGFTDLQRAVKPMAIEEALYVWQLGTDEEKLSISPILAKKVMNLSIERRTSLQDPLKAFFKSYNELSKAEKKMERKPLIDRLRELRRKVI